MTNLKSNGLGKIAVVGIISTAALSLGACSTTSSMTAQGGAPITYKADQGKFQQASLSAPVRTMPAPSVPLYTAPAQPQRALPLPPVQSVPVAPITPAAPNFDQSKVDTDLYAHQRIGKKYKIMGKSYTPKHQPYYNVVGTASWYGDKFHGKLTANGENYDMNGISAAHKTLPLNSMVYVTNVKTGKGMMVRINDRGPFVGDRIIDLSRKTAQQLGLFTSGLATVRVQYAGPADPNASKGHKRPKSLPTPRRAPDMVAEVPNMPSYKPLRDLGTAPASPAALPVEQFPFQPETKPGNPLLGLGSPQAVPYTAPQAVQAPDADAPITLTIKGPIHMAGSTNDGSQPEAKFIPAVNYTQIPAGK